MSRILDVERIATSELVVVGGVPLPSRGVVLGVGEQREEKENRGTRPKKEGPSPLALRGSRMGSKKETEDESIDAW